jgi:ADP-heptose:LPS heptosyltransferase
MSWELSGRPLRRVLVTRLRYLGDVVMSTVVVEMLRRGDRDLEIDFLCEAGHAPVLQGHPDLARVHALGARRRGADAKARAAMAAASDGADASARRGTVGTIRALRRRRYDAAVDLFFNPRSAWLLALAGIPARIAGAVSGSRRSLYTHRVPSPSPGSCPALEAHAGGGLAEHLVRLSPLRRDGRPFLDWFAEEAARRPPAPFVAPPPLAPGSRDALDALELADAGYTLLAPAATWPTKEWPLARWRRLTRSLVEQGERLAVLQPPGRPDIADALADAIPAGHGGVLPPLPLVAALAVVGAARRLVSVDGGIMHAAVGMRVPTLALFGPTDPRLWFPYESLGPYRVLATRPACHPCHRHTCDAFICLPGLDPRDVLAGLDRLGGRKDDAT